MEKPVAHHLAEFLSKVPFFAEVNITSLEHLCDDADIRTFERRALIFEKGDIGDCMYVILEGRVKVHENQYVYDHLQEGTAFGEFALIDNQERSASVTAVEKTRLLEIGRDEFLNLMSTDSGFAQGILAEMIKRHRELDIIQEKLASSKEELELGNAQMKGLINGAMDNIIMFDEKFKILLTNPSAQELLENDDVIQRNLLFFLDDSSAKLIEETVQSSVNSAGKSKHTYLPTPIKVIGSKETATQNEGTLSKYGTDDEAYFILILRNIEDRLKTQDKIERLTTETIYLKEEIRDLTDNYGIIGEDPTMLHVLSQVEQVAQTDATVLINGETGTGKELFARAIHNASPRSQKALIRINCGAIPANLIESELFGHQKGAFTGATENRKGRFMLADKGTIFLDEIGELPLELQPKLLRVIQEGEFEPVGSAETIKVDVRIIAATHRNLLKLSKEGKFREDLFYRLNVFPIEVPALRDRGNDLCLIAQAMVDRFTAKLNKPAIKLSDQDKAVLSAYNWPGNVRELQNLVERAIIITSKGRIQWKNVLPNSNHENDSPVQPKVERVYTVGEMAKMEKENILRALKQTRWKISGDNGAAALLKIPPTTLASKIKSLGISRPI